MRLPNFYITKVDEINTLAAAPQVGGNTVLDATNPHPKSATNEFVAVHVLAA
jgi:hypothetical protein